MGIDMTFVDTTADDSEITSKPFSPNGVIDGDRFTYEIDFTQAGDDQVTITFTVADNFQPPGGNDRPFIELSKIERGDIDSELGSTDIETDFTYTVTQADVVGRPIDEELVIGDNGGANVFFNFLITPCFAKGTEIRTRVGPVKVEDLQAGMQVIDVNGDVCYIVWIGRKSLMPLFGISERDCPVRIKAGALAPGVPNQDLTITCDHALLLDGYLVNASALVGRPGVDFVPLEDLPPRFDVYHVECTSHIALLANGTPAESYIDLYGRQQFDNWDARPEARVIAEMEVPRISAARLLPPHLRVRSVA